MANVCQDINEISQIPYHSCSVYRVVNCAQYIYCVADCTMSNLSHHVTYFRASVFTTSLRSLSAGSRVKSKPLSFDQFDRVVQYMTTTHSHTWSLVVTISNTRNTCLRWRIIHYGIYIVTPALCGRGRGNCQQGALSSAKGCATYMYNGYTITLNCGSYIIGS